MLVPRCQDLRPTERFIFDMFLAFPRLGVAVDFINLPLWWWTLHSGRDFDDDDVTALQGLGGLPEGLGNLDGIVGWIHGKELLGVFWCHCGDLFGQRPKA